MNVPFHKCIYIRYYIQSQRLIVCEIVLDANSSVNLIDENNLHSYTITNLEVKIQISIFPI